MVYGHTNLSLNQWIYTWNFTFEGGGWDGDTSYLSTSRDLPIRGRYSAAVPVLGLGRSGVEFRWRRLRRRWGTGRRTAERRNAEQRTDGAAVARASRRVGRVPLGKANKIYGGVLFKDTNFIFDYIYNGWHPSTHRFPVFGRGTGLRPLPALRWVTAQLNYGHLALRAKMVPDSQRARGVYFILYYFLFFQNYMTGFKIFKTMILPLWYSVCEQHPRGAKVHSQHCSRSRAVLKKS
jgi:hypothetical protein